MSKMDGFEKRSALEATLLVLLAALFAYLSNDISGDLEYFRMVVVLGLSIVALDNALAATGWGDEP